MQNYATSRTSFFAVFRFLALRSCQKKIQTTITHYCPLTKGHSYKRTSMASMIGFAFFSLVFCSLEEVLVVAQVPTLSPTNVTDVMTSTPTTMPTFVVPTNTTVNTTVPTGAPTTSPVNPSPDTLVSIYDYGLGEGLRVVELAQAVGLTSLLQRSDASLTLLAPVNAAFDALHPKISDYLLSTDNIAFLRYIVEGHVFEGSRSSADLRVSTELTAQNGFTNRVQVDENNDILVEFAKVLTPDIAATNGVIHLMDSLVNVPTLSQVVPSFMRQAMAGLLDDPMMDGATFFLPSLFAFAGLSDMQSELSDAMLNAPSFDLHLAELLRAHIVPDIVLSSEFQHGDNITMANGDVFIISISNETVSLSPGLTNGKATVLEADVLTVRSVVHQVNGLLQASFLSTTLVDVVTEHASTLAMLVVSTEMDNLLATTFNITGRFFNVVAAKVSAAKKDHLSTPLFHLPYVVSSCFLFAPTTSAPVFAPTNAAFDELSDATIEYLQSEAGQPTARAILSYHVASGVYSSMDLLSMGNATTISSLYRDDPALIQVWQGATRETVWLSNIGDDELSIFVVKPDILANNGILHVISSVMTLPPPAATTPAPTDDAVPEPTPPVPTPPPQPSGAVGLVVAFGGAADIVSWLLMAVTLVMAI